MIVTFSTRHGQLTMLGEPAVRLLELGGHSGQVPGAVLTIDLPAFLAKLRSGLALHGDEVSPAVQQPDRRDSGWRDPGAGDDEPRERPINLRLRAVPLLDMIETAVARGSDLMWARD
jgi:hypothetical protein